MTTDDPLLWHKPSMRIVQEVRRRTVVTRKALEDTLRLHKGTLSKHIKPLIEAGFLEEREPSINNATPVQLAAKVGALVGVEMTTDDIVVGVTDASYELLGERTGERVEIDDVDATVATIARRVVHALDSAGIADADVIGVGIGLPGPIERDTGAPHGDWILPGWDGVPVRERLEAALADQGRSNIRAIVANDASVGALGVFTRAVLADPAGAPDDLLYVRITHGIGAGLVLKGHLVTGGSGFAGEIGHVQVVPTGPLCPRCGARGCLEIVASETAVLREIRMAAGLGLSSTIEGALKTSHPARQRAVWDAGWHVGTALGAACNLVNPRWVILGGTMAEHPTFREAVEHGLERGALPQANLKPRTWGDLWPDDPPPGRDIGAALTPELLGALALVVDELGDAHVLRKLNDKLRRGQVKPDP